MTNPAKTRFSYSTGHPWYYLLGGRVLALKEIREATRYSGYKGYRGDEIAAADKRHEPQRSSQLRKIRTEVMDDLKRDISGYRQRALELHRYRKRHPFDPNPVSCDDIHTNISLKHNHLVNAFGHLIAIDDLLSQQGDLFG
jgi:hypothetical protein